MDMGKWVNIRQRILNRIKPDCNGFLGALYSRKIYNYELETINKKQQTFESIIACFLT